MRLDGKCTQVILAAGRQARGLGHGYVGCEHLLLALTQEPSMLGALLRG